MPGRLWGAVLLLGAVSRAAGADSTGAPEAAPPPRPPLVEQFRLFPELAPPPPKPLDLAGVNDARRVFHQAGDPDSLFTFGKASPQGELHLKAALEVNEVTLKALAPDARVDPTDTRPRSAGDYRALDASGRPYQLRLGARLVW